MIEERIDRVERAVWYLLRAMSLPGKAIEEASVLDSDLKQDALQALRVGFGEPYGMPPRDRLLQEPVPRIPPPPMLTPLPIADEQALASLPSMPRAVIVDEAHAYAMQALNALKILAVAQKDPQLRGSLRDCQDLVSLIVERLSFLMEEPQLG